MPDPEAGFALTPEQEIYYERHREEFEEALSEAMCNVIESPSSWATCTCASVR